MKEKKIEVNFEKQGIDMNVDREDFALALKTWRLRQGYTQRQVAEMWGVSRHTIIRAESGRNITWEMAYRLFAKLSHELSREQS